MSSVSKDAVVDLVKNATQVNLRYSVVALKLAREYVQAFDGVLRARVSAGLAPASHTPSPEPAPAQPARRAPILLAGRAGGQASGAFLLNNNGDTALTVNLITHGDIDPDETALDPAFFVLEPGGSRVVQIGVLITEKMTVDRDYLGAVVAPSLAAPPIEFVVRRLADATPPRPVAKAQRSRAGG